MVAKRNAMWERGKYMGEGGQVEGKYKLSKHF